MNQFPTFKIVIDTREQAPLPIPRHWYVRGTLKTADYSILGYESAFAIERKSLQDLVGSLTHGRARFMREMERLKAFQFKRILVEAPYKSINAPCFDFSLALPKAIRASVAKIETDFGIPFCFADGRKEATHRVLYWAKYWVRYHPLTPTGPANGP